MAEFPHFGSHCDVDHCNQLDFLPIKCDSCQGAFCTSHFVYNEHNCPEAYRKNIQVPVCPICNQLVPTPRGIPIDHQVNEHIQNNCETIKKQKVYANRCTVKGCKKKELIPITCPTCSQNYCLGHRHEKDHNCAEISEVQRKNSSLFNRAIAAMSYSRNNPSDNCSSQARQVSSDEQIARALQDEYNRGASEGSRRSSQQQQQQQRGGQNCLVS